MAKLQSEPARPSWYQGWTLLQVVIAMAVLATLGVTMMDLLGKSGEITHLSWEVDRATTLAEAQLELARALRPENLPKGEGQPLLIGKEVLDALPFGDGKVDVLEESDGLLRVRAQVSWGGQARKRSVVLETLLAVPPAEK